MKQVLKYLQLPDVMQHSDGSAVTAQSWPQRRAEILALLQSEMYGKLPPDPTAIREVKREDLGLLEHGAARSETITLELTYPTGTFTFPFTLSLPVECETPACIITIGMKYDPRYLAAPPAEVFRQGFAVAHLWCASITADGPGYDDALPAVLYPQGHQPDDAGKLLIWGRCMSYIRTYLEQRGGFDLPNTVFAGCSRFGKTALVGGLFDERIRHVASVCSGTAGTAILRGKVGETVENITNYAPHWFCDKFAAYAGREDDLPFDAHFIVAAFAPRNLIITGALEDFWCDPYWELLACVAGSPAHELLGMPGFLYEGPHPVPGYRYPVPGDFFHEGNIAYAMRAGGHGFFPEDWQRIVEFVSERKA